MKIAIFDAREYEKAFYDKANETHKHQLTFFPTRLHQTTMTLAAGFEGVAVFVNDCVNAEVIEAFKSQGVKIIATRSAGFNQIDLASAAAQGIKVARVPEYSPYAVAEHALALILALNRKTHIAYNRVRDLNFSLDGLVGFDLHGKTVGIIGTGKIGRVFARLLQGFGCNVIAFDAFPNEAHSKALGFSYVDLDTLLRTSDILSLHVPLNPKTHHLINEQAFSLMKPSAMLINTSRGGLVDTRALIQCLKEKRIGAAGLDVYEEEEGIFFENLSATGLDDDILARLLTFPNVLITSHQGFLTNEALGNIAETTLLNFTQFEKGQSLTNEVTHNAN